MRYRLLVIANLGFIIGIIIGIYLKGLYLKVGIILFLSIFVIFCAQYCQRKRYKWRAKWGGGFLRQTGRRILSHFWCQRGRAFLAIRR